jgi:hypothetical protein
MKLHYDRKACFLPPHPLQEKFYQLLFHHKFVLKSAVDDLTLSDEFGVKSIALMEEMISRFSLTDSTDLAIFSIVFFRAVFDYAYENRPAMFRLEGMSNIRRLQGRIRVRDTGACPKYLPPFSDDDTFAAIIARDDLLILAGKELTAAAFYNSPLDALYCVHLALTQIRKFVGKTDAEMTQSFDTIFGLFLVVLFGCDLPSPEETFDLVETYAPSTGLSGPLEYARSTISAAALQCNQLLQNLKDDPVYPLLFQSGTESFRRYPRIQPRIPRRLKKPILWKFCLRSKIPGLRGCEKPPRSIMTQ